MVRNVVPARSRTAMTSMTMTRAAPRGRLSVAKIHMARERVRLGRHARARFQRSEGDADAPHLARLRGVQERDRRRRAAGWTASEDGAGRLKDPVERIIVGERE